MKINKVFRIPIKERFTSVGETAITFGPSKYTVVDGVGLLVYYDNEENVNPEFIRKHLIGRRDNFAYIVANSPGEAIGMFLYNFEGAQIGGESEDKKAIWINREKSILEMPYCPLMHKNDRFVCGPPTSPDNNSQGEYGMCVLEGYDAPDNCPIPKFFHEVFKANVEVGEKDFSNTPFYQAVVLVPKNTEIKKEAEVEV